MHKKIVRVTDLPRAKDPTKTWMRYVKKYGVPPILPVSRRSAKQIIETYRRAITLINDYRDALRTTTPGHTSNITLVQLSSRLGVTKYFWRDTEEREWEGYEPDERIWLKEWISEANEIIRTQLEADLLDKLGAEEIRERTGIFLLKTYYNRHEIDIQMTGEQKGNDGEIELRSWDGSPFKVNKHEEL